jgi:hypothetical protein
MGIIQSCMENKTMKINKKALLGAAVSGILLAAAYSPVANAANGGEVGECHGVNECKGKGECAGARKDGTKYTCAGNNECKGQGYITMSKSDCDAKGGTFKAKT